MGLDEAGLEEELYRQALEKELEQGLEQGFNLAFKLGFKRGFKQGFKKGQLSGVRLALRRVLERRGLQLSPELDARIEGGSDFETLSRWLDAAIGAESTAEALK